MRYRTGPIAGTLTMTVLAALGITGEIAAGFHGQSVGSVIFALVVVSVFSAFAVVGLNQLRGVRTGHRQDGAAVLRLPRLVPSRDRRWRTVAALDIRSLGLVYVGSHSRLYNLGVTLRDGTAVTSGAIAVNPPRSVRLADTRAAHMVDLIRQDLGLDPA